MKIFKWFSAKKKEEEKDFQIQEKNVENTKYEIEPEAICPYCSFILKKFPARSSKCSNCGEKIYILKYNNYQDKKLITEKEKVENEAESKKISFRSRWLTELNKFGIKDSYFFSRKEDYFKKTGIYNNDNDVIWSLFNELVFKSSNNLGQLQQLYYSQALFLHEEGKDNFNLLLECARTSLLKMEVESELLLMVEVCVASNSCENCKKSSGRKMTIKEAYEEMPIPHRNCTNSIGFCRCYYGGIAMRDEEGDLILKKK